MLVHLILMVTLYVLWRMGVALVLDRQRLGAPMMILTVLFMAGVGGLAYVTLKKSEWLSKEIEEIQTSTPEVDAIDAEAAEIQKQIDRVNAYSENK